MTKTYVKKTKIGVIFMSGRKTDAGSIPDYEVLFNGDENPKGKGSGFLKKLLKKNWYKLIISSILYTIKACPNWIIPILTANIITLATNQTDGALNGMILNTIILFAVSLQNIPTHMLYARYTDKMLRTIGAGLRSTLIRKLQHLSVTYHKEMESGKIQSKFLRDIESVEMLNNRFVKNVIPAVIGALISIGISISKSGSVTLFFLFVIPINVGLVYAFRKKMRKTNSQFRSETESISAKLTTMLEMIPVTKAHGLEEEEIASLDENIRELTKKGLVVDKANAYSEESSKGINEIGLMNPNFLRGAVRLLVANGTIIKTDNAKYYLSK